MGRIFDTQDYLVIKLYYTIDIEGTVANQIIKYIDPEGTEGEWTAEHDEQNKCIYYTLPQGSPLGIAGTWIVWSYLTMDDDTVLPGEKARFKVFAENEL